VTDPKQPDEHGAARDELDVDAESVKDLDVDEHDAENVHGGQSVGGTQPGPTH